jgi:5-methylcytosine-specific restriction endonuclease McrA
VFIDGAELVPKKSAQARFRRSILEAFDHRCAYCDAELTAGNTTLDHVRPKAKGGQTERRNLVACCSQCNGLKGAQPYREWLRSQPFWSAEREARIERWIT